MILVLSFYRATQNHEQIIRIHWTHYCISPRNPHWCEQEFGVRVVTMKIYVWRAHLPCEARGGLHTANLVLPVHGADVLAADIKHRAETRRETSAALSHVNLIHSRLPPPLSAQNESGRATSKAQISHSFAIQVGAHFCRRHDNLGENFPDKKF
jgi:hypothetical protein